MNKADHWTTKDDRDCTKIFHYARRGWLSQVPREYLTKENMLEPHIDQETPLHWAMCGQIDHVPNELLTPENLLVKNLFGDTPLSWACKQGYKSSLLGIEFPETPEIIEMLGKEWLDENHKILDQLKTETNETNIEIF